MNEVFFSFLMGVAVVLVLVYLVRNIGAFAGQKPDDYADEYPIVDLKVHLTGPMICEGVIFGPLGRVTSTFIADFDIVWDGDTGVMTEVFTYDDKSVQHREWTIKLGEAGAFTTTAPDVPGKGVGMQSGPTVQMCYAIRLPEEAGGHVLKAVDWMYLTRDGTLVNRSQFRKYGIRVAELVATIRKKETT
jgi:hypothetical protein